MTVDRVTEEIAHFIGMFMQSDQPAARDPVYDVFKHLRTEQALSPLIADTPDHRHMYGPEGYDPLVKDEDLAEGLNFPGIFEDDLLQPRQESLAPPVFIDLPPVSDGDIATSRPIEVTMPPVGEGPLPHSHASVTLQTNSLFDRDVLSADPEAVEAWLAEQTERLMDLAYFADVYTPLDLGLTVLPAYPGLASLEALMGEATAYAEAYGAETASDLGNPMLHHLATGTDAIGTFLDGNVSMGTGSDASEQLPTWRDALPQLPQLTPIGLLGPSNFRIGDGTVSAITGGNFALNEAVMIHQRVDAPVILVGGSVLAWDYISQVSVLQDDTRDPGGDLEGAPAVQSAAHLTKGFTGGSEDALPLLVRTGLTPDFVFMSTIEGDLVNYSWTSQWNEVDDSDVLTVNGGKSWIVTGQNTLINAEQLFTSGQGYDLIIVGGDMISAFAVSQTNILADVDETHGTAHDAKPAEPPENAPSVVGSAPFSPKPPSPHSDGGDLGDGLAAAPAASASPHPPEVAVEAASPTPAPQSAQSQQPASGASIYEHTGAQASSHAPRSEVSPEQPREHASGASTGLANAPSEAVKVALTPGEATAGVALSGTYEGAGVSDQHSGEEHSDSVAKDSDTPRPDTGEMDEGQRIASSSAHAGAVQHTSGQTTSVHTTSSQSGTGASTAEADHAALLSETAEESTEETTAADDPASEGGLSDTPLEPGTHDNVIVNSATINHTAVDKIGGLNENLREMIEGLDPLDPDLTTLISSPVFAGLETMSVLYITGDLVNVHALEQTNIVADGDLLSGPGAKDAIAGANALVNSAMLLDVGMDSHVMAAGEIYTDAFLHQAEFVLDAADTAPSAGPTGTQPLASEAVAFLADGMQGASEAFKHIGGDDEGIASSSFGDAGPPADIMQTFLA